MRSQRSFILKMWKPQNSYNNNLRGFALDKRTNKQTNGPRVDMSLHSYTFLLWFRSKLDGRMNKLTEKGMNERMIRVNFFQLFHGKNKSHFEDNDHVCLIARTHAEFDFDSAFSWQNRPLVYSIQYYVIKFVSDLLLRQISRFLLLLLFSCTNKTDRHDITEN